MLTRPMLNIRILFTNYDIITYFLNLVFCSEHFISIKHQILSTFNINKKFNSDSLCAFMFRCFRTIFSGKLLYIYSNNWLSSCFPLISGEGNYLIVMFSLTTYLQLVFTPKQCILYHIFSSTNILFTVACSHYVINFVLVLKLKYGSMTPV